MEIDSTLPCYISHHIFYFNQVHTTSEVFRGIFWKSPCFDAAMNRYAAPGVPMGGGGFHWALGKMTDEEFLLANGFCCWYFCDISRWWCLCGHTDINNVRIKLSHVSDRKRKLSFYLLVKKYYCGYNFHIGLCQTTALSSNSFVQIQINRVFYHYFVL